MEFSKKDIESLVNYLTNPDVKRVKEGDMVDYNGQQYYVLETHYDSQFDDIKAHLIELSKPLVVSTQECENSWPLREETDIEKLNNELLDLELYISETCDYADKHSEDKLILFQLQHMNNYKNILERRIESLEEEQ